MKRSGIRGTTLVEAMVSLAILAIAAALIFPAAVHGKRDLMRSDFRSYCMNAVRTKLNEYKYGPRTNVAGVLLVDNALGSAAAGGFFYSKARYNADRGAYCPTVGASTTARLINMDAAGAPITNNQAALTAAFAAPATFGRHECIEGDLVGGGCPGELDQKTLDKIPEFEVYVTLRRFNPLLWTPATLDREDCPWDATSNAYDFDEGGDMIKVQVTGIARLIGADSFAGIKAGDASATELHCEVSDVVRPPPRIARFWMESTGRIYRWLGNANDATDDRYAAFQSLWDSAGSGSAGQGYLGFTVSPDNRHVFLLRRGEILRFDNCFRDAQGRPDCDPVADPPTRWELPTSHHNVVAITGKFVGTNEDLTNPVCGIPDSPTFRAPVLFGLLDDGSAVCIRAIDGQATAQVYSDDRTGGAASAAVPFRLRVCDAGEANCSPVQRIKSIFSDPTGRSTFVVDDQNCHEGSGSTTSDGTTLLLPDGLSRSTYCRSIYNATDRAMAQPLEVFNARAIAFSL